LLDPKAALVLFESLEIHDRSFLLKSLDSNNLAPILEGVPATDVAETFHTLPTRTVKRMVSLVRKKDAIKKIKLLMEFEPDTAGSLLHPEFIKLHPGLTSKAALSTIHSISRIKDRKHLWALYVTSKEGHLLGAVTLEGLISSVPDSKLADVMTSVEYFKTTPEADQEHVAAVFAKYDLLSMPVVDEENKLLGIILVDDIIDVIKQEATEDIAKMVGSRFDEFQERNIFKIAWFRAPWLLATLIGQFGVFLIIHHFEFAIREIVALASFVPLIPAMGGNIGSQSAMIFVRNLATGQLKGRDKFKAVFREAGIGLTLGFLYGILAFFISFTVHGPDLGMMFCLLVGISVWTAMSVAALCGAIGPLVLEKFGI
ncbi:MAG: magnesium transporter, partial [Candidatus Omnitrophica bacterium]|nr:magnesium transporter [Candidatus Omnitrophota bacterium]